MEEENKNIYPQRNWLKISLSVLLFLVIAGGLIWILSFLWGKNNKNGPEEQVQLEKAETSLDKVVPKDAKSPEDFLEQVQEKSAEIQKNYDTNLTEFAHKRWEKLFKEQNNDNFKELEETLKILSQEIQKTDDQSTLYKVKYRVKLGETERESEDFYYIILSDTKRAELGMSTLKSGVFLTEDDIKSNLARENFVKISKIEK
jgi:hypothetical protein